MTAIATRTLAQLRSVCPGCGLRRFIPHAWAPYCTRSCQRDATSEGAQEQHYPSGVAT